MFTTLIFLTGGVVVLGEWDKGKTLSAKTVIGTFVFAILISGIGEFDPKAATMLAAIALLGALYQWGIPLTGTFSTGQDVTKAPKNPGTVA